MRIYHYFLVLQIGLLSSCSLVAQKVKESSKRKPDWVDEQPTDALVGCFKAADLESAKMGAINNIRERIALSISSSVQSTFTQNTKEVTSGDSRYWNEATESKILIETQLAGALSGVSEAFATDMYWEQLSEDKVESYSYCILYPFTRKQLDDYISQFEINRLKIKRKREELMQEYNNCKTLIEIINLLARVRQEQPSVDPLYGNVYKTFINFLNTESEKIHPRIEREHSSALIVACYTAAGKRVSVNPVYTAFSKVIPYVTTDTNCDSLSLNAVNVAGRRNVALSMEYQYKKVLVEETLYWTPQSAGSRFDVKEISVSKFLSDGIIEFHCDLIGDEFAEIISVGVSDSKGPKKLVPMTNMSKLNKGANLIKLIPNDSSLLGSPIFIAGDLYDLQIRLLNRNGETTDKTIYNVIMN